MARRVRPHRVTTRAEYEAEPVRTRKASNRVLDLVDAWERQPKRSLRSLAPTYHVDPDTVVSRGVVEKVGGRWHLRPAGQRTLYRGPLNMLADVDGEPTLVRVTPANDFQRHLIEAHDKEVFAAVTERREPDFSRFRSRVVRDGETGRRYRFATDARRIRRTADDGGFVLEDLHYSGGRHHDLDALLAEETEL